MKQIFDSFYSITLIWALYFDAFYLLFNYTRAPCCWCCMSIDSIAESAANCLVVDVARDGSRPRHATRPPPRGAATLFIAAQYYLKYKYLVLITLTAAAGMQACSSDMYAMYVKSKHCYVSQTGVKTSCIHTDWG